MAGPVVHIRDLLKGLDSLFPFKNAAPWDKNGLLVGDPKTEISGVVVALDVTRDVLNFAKQKGANVVLTHHPLFIEDLASLNVEHSIQAALAFEALANGIALVNCHTNLDLDERAKQSMGDRLKLNYFGDLPTLDEESSYGALWRTREPIKFQNFAQLVSKAFMVDIRAYGNPEAIVESVATATGSARHRIPEAIASKCHVLIGGEIPYHDAMDASMLGLATIAIGHDVSEWPLADLLYEALINKTYLAPEKIYLMKERYYWNPIRTENS